MFFNNNIKKYLALFVVVIGFVFFVPSDVVAQTTGTDFGVSQVDQSTELGNENLITIVSNIINVALGLLGVVALGFFLYGGFVYMTAGGNSEKVEDAKKIILNSIIGLVIILSSFAIARFVINSLSDATGTGNVPGTGSNGDAPPLNLGQDDGCNWNQDGGYEEFFVHSITPSTESGTDATHMNNITIRVVFSRALGSINNNPVEVKRSGNDVAVDYSVTNDSKVLEVSLTNQGNFATGTYSVSVDESLKDASGKELKEEQTCGGQEYPVNATFTVDEDKDDKTKPKIENFSLNGKSPSTSNKILTYFNEKMSVDFTIDDRTSSSDFGGNSFARVRVYPKGEPGNEMISNYYAGPNVDDGSSESFSFEYQFWLNDSFSTSTKQYMVELRTYDIDGNYSQTSGEFLLLPAHCSNGKLDKDKGETKVDQGGSCGVPDGGSCKVDSDCAGYMQCRNGQCRPEAVITNVSPWNGAADNLVSVHGNYFGNAQQSSTIQFGIDSNNDNSIDENDDWFEASLPAQCQGIDVWNDDSIVVQVPSDSDIPQNSKAAIRFVENKYYLSDPSAQSHIDSTVDDYGPSQWEIQVGTNTKKINGLFTKNDVNRPGLCSVQDSNGASSGLPGDQVSALGFGFNAPQDQTQVFFSDQDVQALINSILSEQKIDLEVPQMSYGQSSVRVNVDGQESNSVLFDVITSSSDKIPTLSSISPSSTTRGSFATIFGSNFGYKKEASSEVWAHQDREQLVDTCFSNNKDSGCVKLKTDLPNFCGDTWRNDSIVVEIPQYRLPSNKESYSNGVYNVAVKNRYGEITDGLDTIEITSGSVKPSICNVTPARGNAPLGEEGDNNVNPLTLKGVNFGSNPDVYFWKQGADSTNPSTWFSDSDYKQKKQRASTISSASSTEIKTYLPEADTSMQTGPILIDNGGTESNQIQYEVRDCRRVSQDDKESIKDSGYRCCTSGPEAGTWKDKNAMCEGEERTSGYNWRFSTAEIPVVPQVVEYCDPNQARTSDLPSPTPRPATTTGRNITEGKMNVCTNASIEVAFTASITQSSIDTNSVELLKCNQGGDEIDCSTSTTVGLKSSRDLDLNSQGKRLTIFKNSQSGELANDTWYRVRLHNSLQSQTTTNVSGNKINNSYNIQRTRPCSEDTAYCFNFKTAQKGTNKSTCSVKDAYVQPNSFVATELGPLKADTGKDLVYRAYGIPHQQCVVTPVDDWDWDQQFGDGSSGADQKVTLTSPVSSTPAKAKGEAEQNSKKIIDITASTQVTTTQGNQQTVTGSSKLNISLGDPQLGSYWPACNNSCTNAQIGAEFNRPMDTSTITASNIQLYECRSETCNTNRTVKSISISEKDATSVTIDPKQTLNTSTTYFIEFSTNITAIGGYDANGDIIQGKPLETEQGDPVGWKFITKDNNLGCTIDRVEVKPDRYISRIVGGKKSYSSVPFGSPNKCSPQGGQRLDPLSFDWDWSAADTDVVTTTNFSLSSDTASTCSASTCLPSGSDTMDESIALCGNGKVEAGEDCDIGDPDETAGVSCTYNCLRPGSTSTAQNPITKNNNKKYCGDGKVQPEIGEECDIDGDVLHFMSGGQENSIDLSASQFSAVDPSTYCSDTCLNRGITTTLPNSPVCGGGGVSYGEDCDTRGGTPRCSNKCLNIGTPLAEEWCTTGSDNSDLKQNEQCRDSISVCGNGELEASEECEIGDQNNDLIYRRNGSTTTLNIQNPENHCTNKCRFENLCTGPDNNNPSALNDIPSVQDNNSNVAESGEFRCDSDQEGCNDDCTLAGSSANYSQSSICGDMNAGTGEYAACEAPKDSSVKGSHVQIATAVGKKTTPVQSSTIDVTAEKTVDGNTVSKEGQGDYFLQCGFEEYENPVENNGEYNNCPRPSDEYGVGDNSCCYPRESRTSETPKDLHKNNTKVCRNTAISAEFGGTRIDESTVNGNSVLLVTGRQGSCNSGEQNITDFVTTTLTLNNSEQTESNKNKGWFEKTWDFVKTKVSDLFDKIFGGKAQAAGYPNHNQVKNLTWCQGGLSYETEVSYQTQKNKSGDTKVTSTIDININKALEPKTMYAVILRSGSDGIKDQYGVGIKSNNAITNNIHDGWIFQTKSNLCTIDDTYITPSSYRYERPNTSTKFQVETVSSGNQKITPITGVYDWEYSWGPSDSQVFDIPNNATSDTITVSSTNQEGTEKLRSEVEITSSSISGIGKTFTDRADLYSLFCQRPWPANTSRTNNQVGWEPYENTTYNFSSYYCASAGSPQLVADDLPLFDNNPNTSTTSTVPGGSTEMLEKWLFFNDKQEDVIGIQLFKNTERKDIRQWYLDNFSGASGFQSVNIDGYSGIQNGTNYYINALNTIKGQGGNISNVYNNIYHFSINEDATPQTREAFNEFINNLDFHTNIPDPNYCLQDGTDIRNKPQNNIIDKPRFSCTNDFDCRNDAGYPLVNGRLDILAKTRDILNSSQVSKLQETTVTTTLEALEQDFSGTVTDTDKFVNRLKPKLKNTYLNNIEQSVKSNNIDTSTGIGKQLKELWNMNIEKTAGKCGNAEEKMKRDWGRFYDLRSIQNSLQSNSPNLESGTYYPGYTVDKWPSWSKLSRDAGFNDLIKDPVNQWSSCGGSNTDPTTCWNARNSTYHCPQYSQVYEYNATTSQAGYALHTPLEYFKLTDSITNEFVSTSPIVANDPWCTAGNVKSPLGGVCGNGIKEQGEDCDPPGENVATGGSCGNDNSGQKYNTCTDNCQFGQMICVNESQCGNGIVESGEECDDGDQNGEYGKCTTECKNPVGSGSVKGETAGYCGDNTLNKDSNDNPLELCDDRWGLCKYANSSGKAKVHIVLDRSGSMNGKMPEVRSIMADIEIMVSKFTADKEVTTFPGQNNQDDYQCSDTEGAKFNIVEPVSENTDSTGSGLGNALNDVIDQNSFKNAQNLPKVLVVLTDGQYNNYGSCNLNTTDDIKNQLTELQNQGVSTYFYSLTTEDRFNDNISELAAAGGTNNTSTKYNYFTPQDDLVSVLESHMSCSSYNFAQHGSCSNSCQQYGNYCGDGIVNSSEECDDGNNNNNDSCLNNCTRREGSVAQQEGPSSCGNGVLEKENGEMCDKGDNNKYDCDPDYGGSCTYCHANTCKLKTKDASRYCGNGQIDKINDQQGYEACDTYTDSNGDEQVFSRDYINTSQTNKVHTCIDKGQYSCNACNSITNNCTECLTYKGKDTIPQMAILNPMIPNKNSASNWSPASSLVRIMEKKDVSVELSKKMYDSTNSSDFATTLISDNDSDVSIYNFRLNNSGLDSFLTRYDNIFGIENRSIESNNLCKSEYKLVFGEGFNWGAEMSRILDDNLKQKSNSDLNEVLLDLSDNNELNAGLFDYPVNGESGYIRNSYITSPAVPENSYRVVVKWEGNNFWGIDNDKEGNFVGNFYGQAMADSDKSGDARVEFGEENVFCDEIISNNNNYWIPSGSNCNRTSKYSIGSNYLIRPHRIGGIEVKGDKKVQSYTILNTSAKSSSMSNGSKVGFYVNTFGYKGATSTIQQHQDKNVTVQIYKHHQGENPEYSIYKPVLEFDIRDSEHSSFKGAKYWHVFNFVKQSDGTLGIQDIRGNTLDLDSNLGDDQFSHGIIKTNFTAIKNNVDSNVAY